MRLTEYHMRKKLLRVYLRIDFFLCDFLTLPHSSWLELKYFTRCFMEKFSHYHQLHCTNRMLEMQNNILIVTVYFKLHAL